MFDLGCLIFDVKRKRRCAESECCALNTSTIKPRTSNIPRGISLVEILISMFVLLFGLMGVVSIFPVGNHLIVEAEKYDLGSSLAQNAFEELVARGMLRPEVWLYADNVDEFTIGTPVIDSTSGLFLKPAGVGAGHAFILDPLGAADLSVVIPEREFFPWNANSLAVGGNPWNPSLSAAPDLTGTQWPIHRLTVSQTLGIPMSTAVGETIFRLRDDLTTTQPEQGDVPGIQNWDIDDGATPSDPTDDTLLRRQYKGDYSWLATIVPSSGEALAALQPEAASGQYGELRCEVSVVVFRKREVTPSATSERLIEAEFLNDGELVIYAPAGTLAKENVDAAADGIKPGNWIAVAGVNQTTGDFAMKWYRILAIDEETSTLPTGSEGRYLMLDGPDWPEDSNLNLRAIIMPEVISVATHPLHMEGTSLWSLE